MKRFLLLIAVLFLPGCLVMEETYYEDYSPQWVVPAATSCQAPAVQTSSTYSSTTRPAAPVQTREPELAR